MSVDTLASHSEDQSMHQSAEQWLRSLPLPPRLVDLPQREQLLPESRVKTYRTAWACSGKDPKIVDAVAANIRYLPPELFQEGLAAMAAAIDTFVGNDPYYTIIDSHNKSGGYISSAITPLLQRSPESRQEALLAPLDPALPTNPQTKFVIVDDATYSGSYALVLYRRIRKAFPALNPRNILIAYVGMAVQSLASLEEAITAGVSLHTTYCIPTLSETLPNGDIAQIKGGSTWPGNPEKAVLTILPHRVPDNFCGDFRASNGRVMRGERGFFLINDLPPDGIFPPYH